VPTLSDGEIAVRVRDLEWLLLDVDGVFTDGKLLYGASGEEHKVFDVRDGLGTKLVQKAGIKVGILSGRGNEALKTRADELGLDTLIQDRSDKATAFSEFLAEVKTLPERVAYMGDDLLDLPVMRRCALAFAPADAVTEVRERVHRVLSARGGHGAVRELCELLLRARGDWERLIAPFLED
jgi:3-deoxy-D-manno-octulosonate 8-phosphate phosphatase (KDO 8-P phosphatase)